jgi:hypothetical protein
MNDTKKEILKLLQQRLEENPDWEFVQLLPQFCYLAVGHTSLGDMTDEEMLRGLQKDIHQSI